jgi:hypothetical protein
MSNLTVKGNASGTGTIILESPNTNSNRTITLPDATATLASVGNILTLGTAVASTSGTAIDFTGIPSTAKRVTVMFQGVSLSGTDAVQFQLGTSAGFVTSGYLGSCNTLNASGAPATLTTSGFRDSMQNGTASVRHGFIVFNAMGSNVWVASGAFADTSTTANSVTMGSVALSGALDRVRINTSGTNTFDSGTINIMWEG